MPGLDEGETHAKGTPDPQTISTILGHSIYKGQQQGKTLARNVYDHIPQEAQVRVHA